MLFAPCGFSQNALGCMVCVTVLDTGSDQLEQVFNVLQMYWRQSCSPHAFNVSSIFLGTVWICEVVGNNRKRVCSRKAARGRYHFHTFTMSSREPVTRVSEPSFSLFPHAAVHIASSWATVAHRQTNNFKIKRNTRAWEYYNHDINMGGGGESTLNHIYNFAYAKDFSYLQSLGLILV